MSFFRTHSHKNNIEDSDINDLIQYLTPTDIKNIILETDVKLANTASLSDNQIVESETFLEGISAEELCEIMLSTDLSLQNTLIHDFTGTNTAVSTNHKAADTQIISNEANLPPIEIIEIDDDAHPQNQPYTPHANVPNNDDSAFSVIWINSQSGQNEPGRKYINKPKRLDVRDRDFVSKEDGTPLTSAELNSLKNKDGTPLSPSELDNLGSHKGKKFFERDGALVEAIRYGLWWTDYVWVFANPTTDRRMVYVDPKEYKNIQRINNKYSYGNPAIDVMRYGAYRKKYDVNNVLQKNNSRTKKRTLSTQSSKADDHVSKQPRSMNFSGPGLDLTTCDMMPEGLNAGNAIDYENALNAFVIAFNTPQRTNHLTAFTIFNNNNNRSILQQNNLSSSNDEFNLRRWW